MLRNKLITIGLICIAFSFGSSNAIGSQSDFLNSTGVAPIGGFVPTNNDGTHATTDSFIKCAGGDLGNSASGSNCLFTYNQADGSGSILRVWNNDNGNQPHIIFDVDRAGFIAAQGIRLIQRNCGPPSWASYCASPDHSQVFLVMGDVPGASNSVMDLYGCPSNNYQGCAGSSAPALLRLFGNASCCGLNGTEVVTFTDSGHKHYGGITKPGTPTSCGISPSVEGDDSVMFVTIGTAPGTTCTIPFGTAWTSTRVACHATSQTQPVAIAANASATQVTLVSSSTWAAFSVIQVTCNGQI
jgi:hypothetical protein